MSRPGNQLVDPNEILPGEILLENFVKPMGITARQLTADIDVSSGFISELKHGTCSINTDTALRPDLLFGMASRFWLSLQTEYDMRVAVRTQQVTIVPSMRAVHLAAAA